MKVKNQGLDIEPHRRAVTFMSVESLKGIVNDPRTLRSKWDRLRLQAATEELKRRNRQTR